MRIHYVIAIAGIGLTAFLASEHAVSHRDTAKPLFVSVAGSDEGRCLEAANACRTIAYALRQAGKGSQIRVGAGRFSIERSEDLFLLVDGAIEISGGYDSAQDFARRGDTLSTLTGVPEEYRAALRGRGFHVIADTKGAETPLATKTGRLLEVQAKLQKGNQAGTCVSGRVDNLVCDQVDLLSHIPLNAVSARPAAGNDIWGFQDLNTGREYVVAGYNRGTAVFDVTDPTAPGEVGFVDGQNATWRDIKVYQSYDDAAARWRAYAYVTTDGTSDGLFVIDLSDLPHSIRRISYPSQFASA
ncbi:MAG: choice-of-anchor B family protein, partial [Woeseia sp.]|nr:choice-of-anchor B family protein [Woeseia sp.]